jgi:glutamate formiminotransferase
VTDLLECVPNFSEGRNQETIDALRAAMTRAGVQVLDVQADVDHNRSVFTLVGSSDALTGAVFEGIKTAVERIDLRTHRGAHPRMGAADVVPFIPMMDTKLEVALSAARTLGERVASELDLPVYFYEESATRPERTNLEQIRKKGFEELRDQIETDDARIPDLGPRHIHETAGAVVIGARRPLIAYNIYLNTTNLAIAQSIAKSIRFSTGGLRYVKAMGFDIPERGCVQVSMNLTYFQRSAIHTVFEMVKTAAESHGVAITDSEIVGMAPAAALIEAAKHYLRMHDFRLDQVIELRLLDQGNQ